MSDHDVKTRAIEVGGMGSRCFEVTVKIDEIASVSVRHHKMEVAASIARFATAAIEGELDRLDSTEQIRGLG